jgi:hypothetical protein
VETLAAADVVTAAEAVWGQDVTAQSEKIAAMRTLASQNAEIAFSLLPH